MTENVYGARLIKLAIDTKVKMLKTNKKPHAFFASDLSHHSRDEIHRAFRGGLASTPESAPFAMSRGS